MTHKSIFSRTLILLLILGMSCIRAFPAEDKNAPAESVKAKLRVVSQPEGATVVVDRVIRGQAPITLELDKGQRLVRVSLDENWEPFIQTLNLEGDFELRVNLRPRGHLSFQRGLKAFDAGNYPQARQEFQNAVTGGKVIPEGYFYLALLDRIRGDEKGMTDNFREYINLNPPAGSFVTVFREIHPEPFNYGVCTAHFILGEHYRSSYNWGQAATSYKLAIPRRERFIDTAIEASFDNIRALRKKQEENPRDPGVQIQLAYLYELKGMLFQAMMAYRDGARLLFEDSPEYTERFGKYLDKTQ